MMKKFLFPIFLFINLTLFSQTDWTIFAYMEGSEGLQHEALYNTSQLAFGGVPKNVNMFVQVHIGSNLSFFYKIEENNIILLDFIPVGPNTKENIVSTIKRILPEYQSKYFGLFLWDHGFGILEPYYNQETETWDVEPDGNQFGGCDLMDLDGEKPKGEEIVKYKGMFINGPEKTIMGNKDMVELIRTISEDMLGGKKIDLLAMDCCMGAMIEHGYQLCDYAKFLVGSQDCELTDGFDYINLMLHFKEGHVLPRQIAQDIVDDYGVYNAKYATIGRYTMSAMDLSYTYDIASNNDKIANILLQLFEKDRKTFKEICTIARKDCPRFCMIPSYADMHVFYENLEIALQDFSNLELVKNLNPLLQENKDLIKAAVVANVAGKVNKGVRGISIYFPLYHIDSTYEPTKFAQESNWFSFIQNFVAKR